MFPHPDLHMPLTEDEGGMPASKCHGERTLNIASLTATRGRSKGEAELWLSNVMKSWIQRKFTNSEILKFILLCRLPETNVPQPCCEHPKVTQFYRKS